ncbi:hypothetical protein GCM10020331_069960 [Ectobacillus funiculus]
MGVRVVRAFNRDPYEQKRFETANYDFMSVSIRVNKNYGIYDAGNDADFSI